jgi:hypothetical protein
LLVQFEKNIRSWIFQRLQIALVFRTRTIFIVFEKITRACFFSNCTQNHTIFTYTNTELLRKMKSYFLILIITAGWPPSAARYCLLRPVLYVEFWSRRMQWTIPQLTKILNSTSLDKDFITAWKSITKLVIFQSFVAKCCKMRII